jgi:type II restriction enzyme
VSILEFFDPLKGTRWDLSQSDEAVQIIMNPVLATAYKSRSQIARVVTEDWAARNLYCPACEASSVVQSIANTHAFDFACGSCETTYQLKAGKNWSERIPDAGYEAMIRAIKSDRVPSLLVMQYDHDWRCLGKNT